MRPCQRRGNPPAGAEGADQGVIDSDERNMVNRVMRLGDRTVDSVMTPRTRIAWLDAERTAREQRAGQCARRPTRAIRFIAAASRKFSACSKPSA